MKRIILIYFAIFVFTALANAQDYVTPKVTVEYDKFKDTTVVALNPVFVIKAKLQFGLMMGYKGSKPIVPKNVLAIFMSASLDDREQYRVSRGVIILADGERIDLGTATHATDYNKGFYIEAMLVDLPFETLQKINKAKSVEIQIGSTDFALQPEYREAMREFEKKFLP